ncbi:MAG: autotransporter-associated beta strand repeat-containing protein, partial [Opitutaceae bacterium]|nr:autotransporter-associated beta strand repeat-containing protein [Opitutaceae bacterium]
MTIFSKQTGNKNHTTHMTKANLTRPAGRLTGLIAALALAAAFLHSSLAVPCSAQLRDDNRRLFWTGSNGAVWDNTTASWMTTGSYLSYANRATSGTTSTWVPTTALPETRFLAGDVAIFDGVSDTSLVWSGSVWIPGNPGDPVFGTTRTIDIASGGVTASDVVVYASSFTELGISDFVTTNHYVFTGGAIIADPTLIGANDVQLTGTGVGLAAGSVVPAGRLIKQGAGTLTLSNTAANVFPGGIHLLQGNLTVTTPVALGDNNIILNYITTAGNTTESIYGPYYGAKLLPLIMQPGGGVLPAVVLANNGRIMTVAGADPTLRLTETADGIDITGDLYISNRLFTIQVDGTATATISGDVLGLANAYGSSSGTIIKTGAGALVLSGTRNRFYGAAKNYSRVDEGRVVATSPTSLGVGAWEIAGGAVLEFRGVKGTVRQAFIGGGNVEVTQGSDLTFDWRSGSLDGYDGMSGNASWHPAKNDLSNITISGQSRFTAMASGTYSEVL